MEMDLGHVSQRQEYIRHCEFGEGIGLQEEAAFLMHSFRDREPKSVVTQDPTKKSWYVS